MRLVWDCETNGLLKKVDRLHTLHIKDLDSDNRWTFRQHGHVKGTTFDGTPYEYDPVNTIEEGLDLLQEADMFIFHNGVDYDMRVLAKLYPERKFKAVHRDTLILARLITPDTTALDMRLVARGQFPRSLINKHKLEAWGYRLGLQKGDYAQKCKELGRDPWAEWNPDLEAYGDLDVDVTEALWKNIEVDMPELGAVEGEHDIAALAAKIRANGFPFDHAAALTLDETLKKRYDECVTTLKTRYGFWFAPEKKRMIRPVYEDPDAASRPTPRMKAQKTAKRFNKEIDPGEYQDNGYHAVRPEYGEDDSRSLWAEVTIPKRDRTVKIKDGDRWYPSTFSVDAPYCKIKRVDFNPGSRLQIADRLVQMHNWSPSAFTESGQPEISDKVFSGLKDDIPEAADFADLFFHSKLLGQLSEGEKSWLNSYDEETGCIHPSLDTCGTVSGRCAHRDPNIGQVPGVLDEKINGVKRILTGREGEYGWECRSLFYTPEEIDGEPWRQIGCDLKNIEARCLAAVFAPYDDGELIHELTVKGTDLHDFNMRKTGITNRGIMKRVFFGLIYGAGDLKLGITADPKISEAKQRRLGKDLRATIMHGIPALKRATDKIKEQAKSGYLIGLDGRRLQVRAEYAALNLRLQSDAALIAKKWTLLTEQRLIDAGGRHGWDGDFAMLAFVHDEIQTAIKAFFVDEGARIICDAAREAGEFYNFICPVEAEAKIGQNWAECH